MKIDYEYKNSEFYHYKTGYYLTFDGKIYPCGGARIVLGHDGFSKYHEICKQCNAVFYKYSFNDDTDTPIFKEENDALKAAIMLKLAL